MLEVGTIQEANRSWKKTRKRARGWRQFIEDGNGLGEVGEWRLRVSRL